MKRLGLAAIPAAGLLLAVTVGTASAHDTKLHQLASSKADLTSLPLGDQKWSTTTYEKGSIYLCSGSAPSSTTDTISAPWINSSAGTFDLTIKAGYAVDGSVSWASQAEFTAPTLSGTTRAFSTNDLPSAHNTGVFPIASTDNAKTYDGNPNSISEQSVSASLRATPTLRSTPQCVGGGTIAVMTTGVVLFNGLDSKGRDALANEIGDSCDGHPQQNGMYHYHALSACISDDGEGHSALVGYAMDGFGLYGYRGDDGAELTNDDLDECHGHTHEIEWDGKVTELYHYHATHAYPYTIGCFRGTAAVVSGGTSSGSTTTGTQRGTGATGQASATGTPGAGATTGGQGATTGQGQTGGQQSGGQQGGPTSGGQPGGGQTGGQGTGGAPSGTPPAGGQQSGAPSGGTGGTGGTGGQTGPGAGGPGGGTQSGAPSGGGPGGGGPTGGPGGGARP